MCKKLTRVNQLKREIELTKKEDDGTSKYQDAFSYLYRELIDLYFDLKGTTAFSLKLTDKNNNTYYLSDDKETQLETVVIYFENEKEINSYLTDYLKNNYILELERKNF